MSHMNPVQTIISTTQNEVAAILLEIGNSDIDLDSYYLV